MGGLVSSVVQRRTAMTRCESSDDDKSFFDTLLPKDKDGKVCWDKAPQQVTDSIFWDKIAKATGQQVRGHTTISFYARYISAFVMKMVIDDP